MAYRIYKVMRWGAIGSATLVVLLCGCAIYFSQQFLDATSWVNHSTAVIGEIRNTRALLDKLEPSGAPGSHPSLSVSAVLDQFDRVVQLTRDSAFQQQNGRDFRTLLTRQGYPSGPIDLPTIQAAHSLLGNMQSEEYRLLSARIRSQVEASRSAAITASILCGSLLILGLVIGLAARKEFRLREKAEATLLIEKQDLTRYSRELALVSAGSELIQAANDEAQLNAAVAQIMGEMLPESSGYFGLVSPSKDMVEICSSWGSATAPEAFPPTDCVALQLGRKIHRDEALVHLPCRHIKGSGDSICLPLRSSTGFLGMIHVESADAISRKRVESIGLFAAQVTLGLTNLRMREALRSQSVRDSLTGLFNRRYFDETLQREIASYRRDGSPISILMLDLDHFKRVNDSFGHAAGDDALRFLGRLMRSSFRESDVICRYGGEEFAVILLNSDLTSAYAKAESFRRIVEQADLSWNGREIGRMTASVGVACCIEFSETDQIVQAADAALYQAKRMGRNSTCVCSSMPVPMPVVKAPSHSDAPWPAANDTALTNQRSVSPFSRVLPMKTTGRPV